MRRLRRTTLVTEEFPAGNVVTLSASPPSGSAFSRWSGACSGTGACRVTMSAARSVTATFVSPSDVTPGPEPQQPDPQTEDVSVGADVIAARVVRSRLGKRVLAVEVEVSERVRVLLTLRRGRKLLARKEVADLQLGGLVRLPLARRIKPGGAHLRVVLTDRAGNTLTVTTGVRIPRA